MKIEKMNGIQVLVCTCGFYKKANLTISESIKEKEPVGEGILDEKRKAVNFPHTCPKCKHEGCEVIDLGPHYSDESDIHLYICDKCGYVDREAEGCSNG